MSSIFPLKAQDFDNFSPEDFDCSWKEIALKESCTKSHSFVLGTRRPDKKLSAFLIYQVVGSEVEIHGLHVHKNMRRQGLGTALLDHMVKRVHAEGATKIFLEVWDDNTPAINLYASRKFQAINYRPGPPV
ncbi:MAG: GNAT family N-acetyltransferase [bacterium]|nr:GNAT family N-acetyltransferase [bacterium]